MISVKSLFQQLARVEHLTVSQPRSLSPEKRLLLLNLRLFKLRLLNGFKQRIQILLESCFQSCKHIAEEIGFSPSLNPGAIAFEHRQDRRTAHLQRAFGRRAQHQFRNSIVVPAFKQAAPGKEDAD